MPVAWTKKHLTLHLGIIRGHKNYRSSATARRSLHFVITLGHKIYLPPPTFPPPPTPPPSFAESLGLSSSRTPGAGPNIASRALQGNLPVCFFAFSGSFNLIFPQILFKRKLRAARTGNTNFTCDCNNLVPL